MEASENFLPIQSLDLEAESAITFNLYVNLPLNQKYILYRRAGGKVESDRLGKMLEGNVANFYIEKKDYNSFIRYVANRLYSLLSLRESTESRISAEATARSLLTSTLQQTDPSVASALMNNLNAITEVIIENALENRSSGAKKIFHRLSQLATQGTDFQKHPVNVASLAVLITFAIGYSKDQILTDVAMAGLLHDLGLSRIPIKLAGSAHDPLKFPIHERDWIYRHPQLSIEILEEKKIAITAVTKTIILQHHEEFNGSGYPSGTRGFLINELSQILRIADEIDLLFADLSENPNPLKARVDQLLRRFAAEKVTEPLLLSRIRKVLL